MNTVSSQPTNSKEQQQRPMLPPIPSAAPTSNVGTIPPPTAVRPIATEDPTWWRKGAIPFIVLIFAAAAADFLWPNHRILGIGSGIGCLLLSSAIILLRKDLSKGETVFLAALACINAFALLVSGNPLNYFLGLLVPFAMMSIPTSKTEPPSTNIRYRNWCTYWTAHRPRQKDESRFKLRKLLPTLVSLIAAAALFIAFLSIFASGNPLVEQVWQWIVTKWNELLTYLNINWDFIIHLVYWFVGIVLFSLYARRRPYTQHETAIPAPVKKPEGTTLLPHLPLFCLIGINMAFLIATSTDIAYLWFKNIPEGISQTAYLHDGADSIIWASILASLILIILFRRTSQTRHSVAANICAYLLILQTFLLAASVYMRLYYQICDYGFTFRRILAGELMLLGLVGLIILTCYIACDGNFRKSAKVCLGTMLLMVIAGGIITPSRLAANLNMYFLPSNPHWKFDSVDYVYGRFTANTNLTFAEMIYKQNPMPYMAEQLIIASKNIVRAANSDTWTTYNINNHQDLPAAKRILADPAIQAKADEIYCPTKEIIRR